MNYTTSEVSKKLGITKDSLRYYEKEGLLPPIERNSSGHRIYSDSDVEWIFLIRCLRDTDMQISKIRKYVSLLMNADVESLRERRDLLLEHQAYIKEKIAAYQNLQCLIEKKQSFYNDVLASDNPDTVRCLDYASEWEHFRAMLGGIRHD